MNKRLILYFTITIVLLAVYSYSQIDLNLTLSSNPLYQSFQSQLIGLGYFNRLYSLFLYLFLILLLFILYLSILKLTEKNLISLNNIKRLIILLSSTLIFSYPAFSYDIFNYMFDARIFTKYGLNPYNFKALDFPNDLWTRFMHWTHRTYPYGPLWILLTIPISFLGFQKFVVSLFLFKGFFILIYLGNCYLIFKIVEKVKPKEALKALAFYSFNPLIIIESIVSPHNDSVMLLFLLIAIYYAVSKANLKSLLLSIFSALIKFTTGFLIVPFLYQLIKKNSRIEYPKMINYLIYLFLISIAVVIFNKEILPWYFIVLVGLSALTYYSDFWKRITFFLSITLLLKYALFIYQGEWFTTSNNVYNIFFILSLFIFTICTIPRNIKSSSLSLE